MNLAQSVAIFCYELSKGLRPVAKTADPASGDLLQVLQTRTRALLDDVHFFGDKSPARMCAELQALAGRAGLSRREASLLLSAVTRLEKAIRRDA